MKLLYVTYTTIFKKGRKELEKKTHTQQIVISII